MRGWWVVTAGWKLDGGEWLVQGGWWFGIGGASLLLVLGDGRLVETG